MGLCVKHGAKGMCVPDYVQAQPDNSGWAYSQTLITVIEQYKVSAQLHNNSWGSCYLGMLLLTCYSYACLPACLSVCLSACLNVCFFVNLYLGAVANFGC